jgi:carbohydrate-binding DOMON domain-containing protein
MRKGRQRCRPFSVNSVDQLSSVVILGLAVAGGIAAVVLDLLLIG